MTEKLFILGTGHAMVTKCYNTCFTISSGDEHFLVDTGGGNGVLTNLEKLDISIQKIHHLFISHAHNDHIMGIVWIIRYVAHYMNDGSYRDNLYIYCHKEVEEIIKTMAGLVLIERYVKYIGNRIRFVNMNHESSERILDWNLKFFDLKSLKDKQFGFTTTLKNGKTLCFLGDEPYKEHLLQYTKNADYLLHEAFCLDSQKEIFKPYEKHHVTVKDACEYAENLKVKTIVIYHTEDRNLENRKRLYTEEGKKYFRGNIIVPDDLEIIDL